MLAVGGHGETMLLSALKSLCSVWFLNLPSTLESFCYYVQSYQGSWGKREKKKLIESLRLSDGYSESLST